NARFSDVAAQAGLRSITIYGQSDRKEYILETLGCGCAFIDFDNDDWLDVFLLSGTRLKDAPPGASNHLFKNNRDGTFTDVTERAGLVKIGWACGVCVGDYNNDGFDDLFVTYWGQNVLYRNNGDGTFTDVTHAAGLTQPAGRWGTGCTFLDYNRDGNLDLFVANYLDFNLEKAPSPGQTANCRWLEMPVACGEDGQEQAGMGAAAGDYDLDGRLDIFKTNFESDTPDLYRNMGKANFEEASRRAGLAVENRFVCWGAGLADFDNNGLSDLFV